MGSWNVINDSIRCVSLKEFGPIDLIAGGPPCQPFSFGGKGNGIKDERNLLPEFVRAVKEVRPRSFIMENVFGLNRPAFAAYLSRIRLELSFPDANPEELTRLESKGPGEPLPKGYEYQVHIAPLRAEDFGVPQRRNRLFLVGFRKDISAQWSPPEPSYSRQALLEAQASGPYWIKHGLAYACESASFGLPLTGHDPWQTVRDAFLDLPDPEEEPGALSGHNFVSGARTYPGHTGSIPGLACKDIEGRGSWCTRWGKHAGTFWWRRSVFHSARSCSIADLPG